MKQPTAPIYHELSAEDSTPQKKKKKKKNKIKKKIDYIRFQR